MTFTPKIPEDWTRDGPDAIRTVDEMRWDNLRWDEDLFLACWNDWSIWIDGGRHVSTWQVTLVEQRPNARPNYVMRDFLESIEDVQTWIDRACRVAHALNRPTATTRSADGTQAQT